MSTATHSAAEQRANTVFFKIMESAPMGLLISAALGLAIVGVFQYIFYLGVFPAGWSDILRAVLSGSLAAFFETLGFYFLVATVRDFSAGHRKEGYIGLLATCLLWAYALWEAHHISAAFDNHSGKYWSIFGIIGTIVCVVRVVELRITLTVTSAFRRRDAIAEAETAIADYRKQLDEATGKVSRYEAETKAANDRKQAEAERLAALEADEAARKQEAERLALFEENETLRKQLARIEKKEAAINSLTGKQKLNQETALRIMREFHRKNNVAPTRIQLAKLAGVDERTVGNCFPNGAWQQAIANLKQEPQPEINETHN